MLSTYTIISGLLGIFILLIAYFAAFNCIRRGIKDQHPLLKWAGVSLAAIGSLFLGVVLSFFNLIRSRTNLPTVLVGQLGYVFAPIAIILGIYVGVTITNQKYAKKATIFYALSAIFYYYGLFFDSENSFNAKISNDQGEGLIDVYLLGYVRILTVFYLISANVVLSYGFYWFGKQNAGELRLKSYYISFGYLIFVLGGIMDALFSISSILIIIRILMLISCILLYKGYSGVCVSCSI